MAIPRIFNISESAHRIHNPFTPEKLSALGAALRLEAGTRVLAKPESRLVMNLSTPSGRYQ